MKIFRTWGDRLDDKQLEQIVERLQAGEIMIWPTDTLYAVACSAMEPKAIERVCALKGINPAKTDLSVVCCSISQASGYARWDNRYFSLLKECTPGPYTLLFKVSPALPKVFKSRKTVGIRIPDCIIDRQIVEALGCPVLTTSVDFPDHDYIINPELIAEIYERSVDFIIDAGEGHTDPSTVIDCTGKEPVLVRLGKGLYEP